MGKQKKGWPQKVKPTFGRFSGRTLDTTPYAYLFEFSNSNRTEINRDMAEAIEAELRRRGRDGDQ